MGFWNKQHNFMENFHSEKWDKFSAKQRKNTLQQLENAAAKEQGREARKVVVNETLGEGVYGRYMGDCIEINSNYLTASSSSEKWNQFSAMDTIFHEGRHAYQDDCVRRKIEHNETPTTIEEWRRNDRVYDEISQDHIDYRFQPLENDANNFAKSKMDSFSDQFSSDRNYLKYMKNETRINAKEDRVAQKEMGTNYKPSIWRQSHVL